jgi:soluble lytic murein transglycosylase
MRWSVVVAVASAICGLGAPAWADIYLARDRNGVLHFTNVPTDSGARMVVKDTPIPGTLKVLTGGPAGIGYGIIRSALGPVRAITPFAVKPSAYDDLIREIADQHDVEYALVKAVIKAESAFDRMAVSRKGALGLMQLMPATAAQHQVRNVFQPRENIEGGVRHLRLLLDRYSGNVPLAVAAYNAGAGRVDDAGGIPPIAETQDYVARVMHYRLAYAREGAGDRQVRR